MLKNNTACLLKVESLYVRLTIFQSALVALHVFDYTQMLTRFYFYSAFNNFQEVVHFCTAPYSEEENLETCVTIQWKTENILS